MRKKKKPYLTFTLKMIPILTMFAVMISCSGSILDSIKLSKPLTHDKKLAIVIKKYQMTTCKESCLVEHFEWRSYVNPDTGITEDYFGCPLDYTEFICIDIRKDENGENKMYKISPKQWQDYAQHLFGLYSHEDVKKLISQIEFLCTQDFAACEDKLAVIDALKQFRYKKVRK